MAFATLTIDFFAIHEIGDRISVRFVNRMAAHASRSRGQIMLGSAVVRLNRPARGGRVPKNRMTAFAGRGRKVEGHFFRFFEIPNRITETITCGSQFDSQSLECQRTRVAVDTSKGGGFAIFDPTTAMSARKIARNHEVETIADFEMKWRILREMTGIAEVVALLDPITADPRGTANQQNCRDEDWPPLHWDRVLPLSGTSAERRPRRPVSVVIATLQTCSGTLAWLVERRRSETAERHRHPPRHPKERAPPGRLLLQELEVAEAFDQPADRNL